MNSAFDLFKYMAEKIMADDIRKALDSIDDKPEKIEPSNINFKSKTDWQVHFIMLENKLNELIEAVNSLKENK